MISTRILSIVALVALLLGSAPSQVNPDVAKKSREILGKMRQLEIVNQLAPLVLTKPQVNALLTVIERCRKKEFELEGKEAAQLRAVEPKVDEALKKGVNEGAVPTAELIRELNTMHTAFLIARGSVLEENVEAVLAVLKSNLNAGQLKAAEKSISPREFDPKAEPEKMTQDDRIRVFIRAVLTDDACYQVLVKMSMRPGP